VKIHESREKKEVAHVKVRDSRKTVTPVNPPEADKHRSPDVMIFVPNCNDQQG
jgi:hypothetical protein